MTIQKNNIELLLMKLEIPDEVKEKAIADFINLDNFRLINQNLGSNKSYAMSYMDFKKTIKLSEAYVQKMLTSRYTSHFYSQEDIDAIWSKWRERLADA